MDEEASSSQNLATEYCYGDHMSHMEEMELEQEQLSSLPTPGESQRPLPTPGESQQPLPDTEEEERAQAQEEEEEEEEDIGEPIVFWYEIEEMGKDGKITKKRRKLMLRSKHWKHFTPFSCPLTKLLKGRCKYCVREIAACPKKHGTKGLSNHFNACKMKPKNVEANPPTTDAIGNWKFDQDYIMEGVALMIIKDEMPFVAVEKDGIREMMARACPWFRMPCRKTVTEKTYRLYLNERGKLKTFIKENAQRVCLTTDTWTSIQRMNYMCLTAHFIDKGWKLRKRILNFCSITGHTGEDIAHDVEKCIRDWGIERIFTITVDNASPNDNAIDILVKKLDGRRNATILGGKYVQVRCIAHIVNLVVRDGLKNTEDDCAIDRIRAAVKYVKYTPNRLKKFNDCIGHREDSHKMLCLDVPTRWNSTYDMLSSALSLKKAFYSYDLCERSFAQDLGEHVPRESDWKKAKIFVEFLEPFKRMTELVSGATYVTSNKVYQEIAAIDEILAKWLNVDDDDDADDVDLELKAMALKMKEKYDKYWGATPRMNHLIYYAVILDPRYKYYYFTVVLDDEDLKDAIQDGFKELFIEYKKMYEEIQVPSSPSPKFTVGTTGSMSMKHTNFLRSKTGKTRQPRSELEKYFKDALEDENDTFDILKWWKENCGRYPILSRMARDILAIPVSTVASESAFSTGGRILDRFRSSLTPRMVQSVICYQDWLRDDDMPLDIEESILDLENRDKDFAAMGQDASILED